MINDLIHFTDTFWLSLMVLLGVVIALVSQKIRFPDLLLLLVMGAIIGQVTVLEFSSEFLASLSIFALVMIVFEATSQFRPKEISEISPYAIKLALVFLVLTLIALTVFTHLLFNGVFVWKEVLLSMLFAAIMSGTSPEAVIAILSDKSSKLVELIEFESVLNTPFTVIIPLVILKLYLGILDSAEIIAISFLREIMTGVGTGLVVGLITFRTMRDTYMEKLSPLMIVAIALVTYTLASYLGGNGVLAVTALGVVFGMYNIKEKEALQKFTSIFTNFLKIVVFLLLGLLIKIPFDADFLIRSVILFVLYILIRFAAVSITFRSSDLNFREKAFLSLNISKGVAEAVVAFVVAASITTDYAKTLLDLIFLFILYSIIVSSFAARFYQFFLKRNTSIEEVRGTKNGKQKEEEEKGYVELKVPKPSRTPNKSS